MPRGGWLNRGECGIGDQHGRVPRRRGLRDWTGPRWHGQPARFALAGRGATVVAVGTVVVAGRVEVVEAVADTGVIAVVGGSAVVVVVVK